jgi:putative protein kinase ArgK-like GTPase of G3E family
MADRSLSSKRPRDCNRSPLFEAIAKTAVNLIRKTPDAPVTIGVHGDWGAGKSSILKMLEASRTTIVSLSLVQRLDF